MNRITGFIIAIAALAALAAGCDGPYTDSRNVFNPATGRSVVLGHVNYENAFAAAQGVMSKYFEIEAAQPEIGIVRCRPQAINAKGERVLGNSPARQVAQLKIVQSAGGNVTARLSIEIQRQGQDIDQVSSPVGDNYSGVPSQTPAQGTGATSADQNTDWWTQRHNNELEARILDEIAQAVKPATTQPTTRP